MYRLIGPRDCMHTLLCLVNGHDSTRSSDLADLRSKYIAFAAEVGGPSLRPLPGEDGVTFSAERIETLLEKYRDRSALTDIGADIAETPERSRREAMSRVIAAKEAFAAVDPDFVAFFDFFIHTMFYQRAFHSGGGSVSSALGVIWCAINRKWSDEDIIEFFVHELAHNMLFLDERANGHYAGIDAIADPRNWALSAVLERPRPLDKVFHSLIVSNEVLQHRLKHGEPANPLLHPSSRHMAEAAAKTIDSIHRVIDRGGLVLPRFEEILSRAEGSFAGLTASPNFSAQAA
jgi:hypothetical protein